MYGLLGYPYKVLRKGIVVTALKEYEIYGLVRGNRIVYIDYILLDDREPMYI